jgi:hypothetical protein
LGSAQRLGEEVRRVVGRQDESSRGEVELGLESIEADREKEVDREVELGKGPEEADREEVVDREVELGLKSVEADREKRVDREVGLGKEPVEADRKEEVLVDREVELGLESVEADRKEEVDQEMLVDREVELGLESVEADRKEEVDQEIGGATIRITGRSDVAGVVAGGDDQRRVRGGTESCQCEREGAESVRKWVKEGRPAHHLTQKETASSAVLLVVPKIQLRQSRKDIRTEKRTTDQSAPGKGADLW